MMRHKQTNHILQCRNLLNQFLVDMYAKIECERLLYIRLNQKKLRATEYIHLRDAIASDGNVNNIGQMVILPSTHTGSPRHMHEYVQDAFTYVQKYGRADLFVTFTCNPNWPEIKKLLEPGQSSSDRHDIIARVFKQKLKKLIDIIAKCEIFGKVRCWMYSIEWQKRGLPHAHILIWLVDRLISVNIDDIISAEIPDPEEDPVLFEIVCKHMIHGPCGELNSKSPCMKDNICTKRYPKDFIQETQSGNDSYPRYRRRRPDDGGHKFTRKIRNFDVDIDNRWVVPYCPLLSKLFDAHINVEAVHSVKSIKYICDYIHKGGDMAVVQISNENDEILRYQMGRYINSNEAVWRTLNFDMHERYPPILRLAVHLENGQRIYFTEETARTRASNPPNTTLTAFFKLCQQDLFAKTLLYAEVPKYYTWHKTKREFVRRKQGSIVAKYLDVYQKDSIGRVYTVHPNNSECFYLRMLLHTIKGPTSFEYLKTVTFIIK